MSSVLDNPGVRGSALRLDVDQYHRLCDSGIVPEKTELLSGIVVSKMGKSPLHTWTVEFLAEWFRVLLLPTQTLRIEQPLTLSDSEPEPDLAIVRGSRDDYRTYHPTTAELVIEVAITTEEIDRAKASIYAAAEISQYWLVLPEKMQVIIYRNPERASARFADASTVGRDGKVTWLGNELDCADVFPDK